MSRTGSRSASAGQTTTESGFAETKRDLRARTEEIEATGGSYQGTHATIWLHNGDSDNDHAIMVSAHALPGYVDRAMNGCSCQDWTFRQPDGGCKHMKAIKKVVACVASLAEDDHVSDEQIVSMMDVPDSAAEAIVKAVKAE